MNFADTLRNTHNDYLTSRSNRLIKSWYQFIGCCDNTVNIILDYEAFYEQIQIKLGTMTKATRLNFPSRYDITEAVKQSLINAGKGRYVLLPSVRLALEFSIVEDIGIKIIQQLKDKPCYHDITDVIFTRKMKADELFDIMVDMKLCTDNEIDTIKRIHEWGSRTVHQGQIVPLSLVWYCLFFVEEDIRRILREESKLKYNENLETFRKLLFDGKIDVR